MLNKKRKAKAEEGNQASKLSFAWPKANKKRPSSFSKRQLAMFIVVFAAIGGFFLYRSFASSPTTLVGDLNGDNVVDVKDLSILLSAWGSTNAADDLNHDGKVDVQDLSILLSNWDKTGTSVGFTTSLTNGMTITPPYTWTFNPGVTTTKGYFWADGNLLKTVSGPGPYTFTIDSSTLTPGTHTLGHGWDTPDGVHHTPDSTYTVTIGSSSSGGGSSGGSSGGSGSTSSYDSAISYSDPANRPVFTPKRTVKVYNSSELESAINNLQAGDLVENDQPGGFTVSGNYQISKNLSSKAVIDLKTGSDAVRFTGTGSLDSSYNQATITIINSSNITIYGGNVTNARALIDAPDSNVTWWNFYIHDTAGDGMDVFPISGGTLTGLDLQGEIYNWGIDCKSLDPHSEKCTGIHAMNASDATGYLKNSRIALYAHDGRSGCAIELGNDSYPISDLTIYLKADNLTMDATSQVAGNGFDIWGGGTFTNIKIAYVEVNNLQGRAIDEQGVYSGNSTKPITVVYGRATDTNQNPTLSRTEPISASEPWDTRDGIIYQDVQPAP